MLLLLEQESPNIASFIISFINQKFEIVLLRKFIF